MRLKLGTIQAAQPGLIDIMKAQMPIKLSYAVSRNIKKLEPWLRDVENKRLDLVKKYGAKDEKTGIFAVTKENEDAFNKEYDEMADQEVDVDMWKLSLAKLSEVGVRLTPLQLVALEDFIEDDTAPAPTPSLVVDGTGKPAVV